MADTISHSSLDSAADEYEVINAEPKLKIADNGDIRELERKLSEVLEPNEQDIAVTPKETMAEEMTTSGVEVKVQGDQQERSPDEDSNQDMEGKSFVFKYSNLGGFIITYSQKNYYVAHNDDPKIYKKILSSCFMLICINYHNFQRNWLRSARATLLLGNDIRHQYVFFFFRNWKLLEHIQILLYILNTFRRN